MLAGDFRFLSNKVSPKACWNKKKSLRAVQGDLGFLAPFLSAHRCSPAHGVEGEGSERSEMNRA